MSSLPNSPVVVVEATLIRSLGASLLVAGDSSHTPCLEPVVDPSGVNAAPEVFSESDLHNGSRMYL